ncbi:MAG: threonylcarbamoyl-AMP synthase [Anaerolineales bacterium]|nr:threonylcarbamoyl-AMP synthase [Anaerolineales bacterium]
MNREKQTRLFAVDPLAPEAEVLRLAAEALIRGELVAFPTETVYGLGAHAFDTAAVRRIFDAKGRPFNDPLIVHLASMEDLRLVASEVPAAAEALGARFWPGPLTLLLPRRASLPLEVSAGLETVAVRVPSHPVAHGLLQAAGIPVAAPSANRFGHASPTLAGHVMDDLDQRIDMILDAGPTEWGVESTILDPLASPPVLLRPGGVSRADLEAVLGPVRIARPGERITASPGRRPRHYAPDARLILCPGGSAEEIASAVAAAARRLAAQNQPLGLLAASEVCDRLGEAGIPFIRRDLGSWSDLRTISRRLFAGLRELEREGVKTIFAHRLPAEGIGAAVNDRLARAADEAAS